MEWESCKFKSRFKNQVCKMSYRSKGSAAVLPNICRYVKLRFSIILVSTYYYLLQWFYIENLTNDDVSGSCQLQIVIYWEYLIEKSGGRSEQALNSLQKFKHLLLITKICGYILVYILRLSRKWNWIRNFNISILEIDFWILNVDINFHSQILNTYICCIHSRWKVKAKRNQWPWYTSFIGLANYSNIFIEDIFCSHLSSTLGSSRLRSESEWDRSQAGPGSGEKRTWTTERENNNQHHPVSSQRRSRQHHIQQHQ